MNNYPVVYKRGEDVFGDVQTLLSNGMLLTNQYILPRQILFH